MDSRMIKAVSDLIERMDAECDVDTKTHFVHLLGTLASCYLADSNERCVVLYHTEEGVACMTVNANQFEATELIDKVHRLQMAHMMADAPPKEMLN